MFHVLIFFEKPKFLIINTNAFQSVPYVPPVPVERYVVKIGRKTKSLPKFYLREALLCLVLPVNLLICKTALYSLEIASFLAMTGGRGYL